jgi:hypothetical protein
MTYVLYGAAGILAVLLLLAGGVLLGWKLKGVYEQHTRQTAEDTRTEEQKRQVRQEQAAFEAMMHYNIDTAYGQDKTLESLIKE